MLDVAGVLASVAPCAEVDSDVVEYVQEALGALAEGTSAVDKDDVEAMCFPLEDFLGDSFAAAVTALHAACTAGEAQQAADTSEPAEAAAPKKLSAGALSMDASSTLREEALSIAAAGAGHALRMPAPHSDGDAHSGEVVATPPEAPPATAAGDEGVYEIHEAPPPTRIVVDAPYIMDLVDWESGTLAGAGATAQAFAHVDDESGGYTEGVLASSWRHTAMGGASGASHNVAVRQLTLATPGGELLSEASLSLQEGHKYGLVGRNGCGKSTLLHRIADGSIPGWPAHLRVGMIEMTPPVPGQTALQAVLACDTRRTGLLALASALEAALGEMPSEDGQAGGVEGLQAALGAVSSERQAAALDAVYDELVASDADAAPGKAAQALLSVGLTEDRHGDEVGVLSGGWQMRVAIAGAVFLAPDILVADEPSNHLDLEGVFWMGQYLASLPCTVVVVSHDGAFLDLFATDIIHFHQGALKPWSTNYSGWVAARAEKVGMMDRLQANLDRKRAHYAASAKRMEAAAAGKLGQARSSGGPGRKLNRLKGDQNKSKQVAQRRHRLTFMGLDKTLDGKKFNAQKHGRRLGSAADNAGGWKGGKMTAGAVNTDTEAKVHFHFNAQAGSDGSSPLPVVGLSKAGFTYPGATQPTLAGVDLALDTSSRIAIVGPNGSGKTTLLRLLAGETAPSTGEVVSGTGTRTAYFSQHHADHLDLGATPVAYLNKVFPGHSPLELRTLLGHFGIVGHTALVPMGSLSGGQRSRVSLAALFIARPHLLIADEITNFFDSHSLDALIAGLKEFTGGLVLVSHNMQLLREVATDFYVVQEGGLVRLEGGLDEYLASSA